MYSYGVFVFCTCRTPLSYTFSILICTSIVVCGSLYLYGNKVEDLSDYNKQIIPVTENQIHINTIVLTEVEQQSPDGSNHREALNDLTPHANDDIASKETQFSTSVQDSSPRKQTSYGYVLPFNIFEQQTAAAQNLWGLQYWAKTVSMKVVEPFFSAHTMSFVPIVTGVVNPLRFSDLYDKEFWNAQSTRRHCSELVGWEDFLENAPKQVILAFVYNYHGSSVSSLDDETVTNSDSITGQQTCKNTGLTFPENALDYFRKLGFYYVRKVCINLHNPMKISKLSQHILSHYNSSDVTIIFPGWSGIRHNKLNIQGVSFNVDNTVDIGLLPSKRIVEDSENYMKKVRPSGGKYFGVMVRTENIYTRFVKYRKANPKIFFDYMLECAANLSSSVFTKHSDWGRTLAIDLGKLGSIKFLKNNFMENNENEEILFRGFFGSTFSSNWTIDDYEGSFKKHLGIDDPAYVAQIQRTIAAKSDCLVMVGGESMFQKAAITFHKSFHQNPKEQCIIYHCYFPVQFDANRFKVVQH